MKQRVIDLIVAEIEFHEGYPPDLESPSAEYRFGFLNGLYQILRLVKLLQEDES